MSDIFRIMEVSRPKGDDVREIRLGIELTIGQQRSTCPVSRVCRSYEDFVAEVKRFEENLSRVLKDARILFGESPHGQEPLITPEMSPQEIWNVLCSIEDEDLFVGTFNGLDRQVRGAVAEYVLTQCNVFSGMASVFSARYDNETTLLE